MAILQMSCQRLESPPPAMYMVTMIGVFLFQRVFARQRCDREQDVDERRVLLFMAKKMGSQLPAAQGVWSS